jgi:hypothetical protein
MERDDLGFMGVDIPVSDEIRRLSGLKPKARPDYLGLETRVSSGLPKAVPRKGGVQIDSDIVSHALILVEKVKETGTKESDLLRTLALLEGYGFSVPHYSGLNYEQLRLVFENVATDVIKADRFYNPQKTK